MPPPQCSFREFSRMFDPPSRAGARSLRGILKIYRREGEGSAPLLLLCTGAALLRMNQLSRGIPGASRGSYPRKVPTSCDPGNPSHWLGVLYWIASRHLRPPCNRRLYRSRL